MKKRMTVNDYRANLSIKTKKNDFGVYKKVCAYSDPAKIPVEAKLEAERIWQFAANGKIGNFSHRIDGSLVATMSHWTMHDAFSADNQYSVSFVQPRTTFEWEVLQAVLYLCQRLKDTHNGYFNYEVHVTNNLSEPGGSGLNLRSLW